MSEQGLIEQIRRGFTQESKAVALGIGDDCAILRPPSGCEVVATFDATGILQSRLATAVWPAA